MAFKKGRSACYICDKKSPQVFCCVYTCKTCSTAFGDIRSLVAHEFVHLNSPEPYHYDLHSKTVALKLSSAQPAHQSVRKFICNSCLRGFRAANVNGAGWSQSIRRTAPLVDSAFKSSFDDHNETHFEVDWLFLDNSMIKGFTDGLANLTVVSIIGVGLPSLQGFPKLGNLKRVRDDIWNCGALSYFEDEILHSKSACAAFDLRIKMLDLSDNKISGGLQVLKDCPNLIVLLLCKNEIKDMEKIEPLHELANLKRVYLDGNEVNQVLKDKVFALLPGITHLDGVSQNGRSWRVILKTRKMK